MDQVNIRLSVEAPSPSAVEGLAGSGDNSVISCAKMWLWSVLWQASTLILVSGTLNTGFFSQKRQYVPQPTTQMNCYEYTKLGTHRFGRAYNEEWRSRKPAINTEISGYFSTSYPMNVLNPNQIMSRRMDKLFPKEDDLVKEHAKLVQDINSLKQVAFIAPFDDTRDVQYDDSIFHEIIETSSTTTLRPTTSRAPRPIKSSSFPIIFVGGESTRLVVRTQPLSFPKSTISLVGTAATPLLKHPYPFVTQGASEKPLRVCMSTLPSYPATTRRPGLWERLINSILPR